MTKKSKILIVGSKGFIGSNLRATLSNQYDVIAFDRNSIKESFDYDFESLLKEYAPKIVINATGKSAGIIGNIQNSVNLVEENIFTSSKILEISSRHKINKVIQFGSSCIYPSIDGTTNGLVRDIGTGPIEPTSQYYAYTKIFLIKYMEALNIENGFKWVTFIPSNLFGAGDYKIDQNAHFVAAISHKLINARNNKEKFIKVLGDGSPKRQMLNISDFTGAVKFVIDNDVWDQQVINVGSANIISIKEIVELLVKISNFDGDVIYDSNSPNGTNIKSVDDSYLRSKGWNNLDLDFESQIYQYFKSFEKFCDRNNFATKNNFNGLKK